ncbi:MAG: glutamate--tRNA ligase family protein [Dysosmobacter sp.]
MSKRHGDPSYEDLKAQGFLTDAILNYVALLGWAPKGEYAEQEFFTMDELVGGLRHRGHLQVPAIFDIEKLTYFNATISAPWTAGGLCQSGRALHPPGREEPGYRRWRRSPPCSRPACEKLTDIPGEGGLLRRAARLRR